MLSQIADPDECKMIGLILCKIIDQMVQIIQSVVDGRGGQHIQFFVRCDIHQEPAPVGFGISEMMCLVYDDDIGTFSVIVKPFLINQPFPAKTRMLFNPQPFFKFYDIMRFQIPPYICLPHTFLR